MNELKPEQLARISFDRWKYSIQTAMGIDQLMLVVSAYLSGWDPKEWPFAVGFIASPDELMSRAVEASRAEIQFQGTAVEQACLRELSLTLAFAASRLRYLQALKTYGIC